jgi:catechol 2,3-dioxygenase-like lactoylglutathione lyase family enzyme
MLEQICPILPSCDFAQTEAFYKHLSFDKVFSDGKYMLLSRDNVEIHFFLNPAHEPATCDHGAYLRPSDVDALSFEIAAMKLPTVGIPRFIPVEDKPWGMRELALIDPDGNLIRAGLVIG